MMKQTSSTVGIGIVIGAAIGVLAGTLFTGNVELGWALIIGAGLGILIASIMDMRRQGDTDARGEPRDE